VKSAGRDVSIIIPAKNEAENLRKCLPAIHRQSTARGFEIIVIDSGSTDATVDVAREHGAKVISIPARDFDHGRSRNLGFEAASGDYLVALVADAIPENERWLDELVAPLEADPNVAGAYSRQIPHDDCHPLAGSRFGGLDPSRLGAEVRSWPGEEEYENLDPREKLKLAEFDDVSSVRRRSVWEKIPVAENYWAEDVDWSLKALRAGYKIAYAPASVVRHSHNPSIRHDFKRAFVDQREAFRRFGITLYANPREAFDSWLSIVKKDADSLKESDLSALQKVYWSALGPVRRMLEVAGGYMAVNAGSEENVARDLFAEFGLTVREGDIRKTVYTLGGKRLNTVFAHPPSRWKWRTRVPPGAILKFAAGIDPQAHDVAPPVVFEVVVEGAIAWSRRLDPGNLPEDRTWKRGAVDLSRWEGKKISVEMTTESEEIAHAWAGWGEPRIVALRPSVRHRLKGKFFRGVESLLTKTPPRHP